MVQEMANKNLRKIVLGATLLTGVGLFSGCAGFYDDSSTKSTFNVLPRFLQPGGHRDAMEREKESKHWEGTAVEKRIVNPDGSIIFFLDSSRIDKSINTDYADQFLDASKYIKTWTWYREKRGFMIRYIPKE